MLLIVFFLLKPKASKVVESGKLCAFTMLYVYAYICCRSNGYIEFSWLSGDVNINPGPRRSTDKAFSICHWNLSSLPAYNYNKLFLLRAYIGVHKFDVICLSETYLDSIVGSEDENLEITGYNLVRSDHPDNTKRGGVGRIGIGRIGRRNWKSEVSFWTFLKFLIECGTKVFFLNCRKMTYLLTS